MRITRLALTDVRRHRALELRPAPGITVIRGPNESGKSTIQQAVEAALFRRANSVAAEAQALRSWDATGDPTIELEFESDGVPARLVKVFAGTKGSARLEIGGAVEADPGRIEQLLVAALGIPSDKFFRSTASVRHFDMEDLDRDEKALRDRLQQSIGGGDVGASKARQMLADNIARYRAAGAKNPGPLKKTQEEIAALGAQVRAGELALDQLSRDRAALAEATAQRRLLEAELRAAETALTEADAAAKLSADRRAVAEQYEHFRRAADLAERFEALEAAPPTALPPATIAAGVERLRTLDIETRDLAAQRAALVIPSIPEATPAGQGGVGDGLAGATPGDSTAEVPPDPATPPPSPVPPVGPWRALGVGMLVLAVVALGVGLAIGPLIGVAGAALAVFAAAVVLVRDRRQRAARDAVIAADQAVAAEIARRAEIAAAARAEAARLAAAEAARRAAADAEARRAAQAAAAQATARAADLDGQIAALRGETATLLADLGVIDRPAAEAVLAAATRHAAAIDGLRAELRGLLGTDQLPPLTELRASRDAAAARAAMGGHALDGMGPAGADPESARLRALAAVRSARTRLDTAIHEEGEAKGRVSQNTVDAEQVAALAERLTVRQEDLAALERRLRIYQQTLDAIIVAEAATMQKAARFLERRMGEDVARITGGRYDRVRVDEADLDITVWSPEREAWIGPKDLSKGTADQLYLAARLGLVRQVTQERRPPLIFDDPFVTFDDARALRAMEVLRELASDHQVLYLTCSDRYDALADAVVALDPPAIVHVEPGAAAPPPPPDRTEPIALTLPLDPPDAGG
jgi:DNA repair exonuclease SbcCD ATPase subunit